MHLRVWLMQQAWIKFKQHTVRFHVDFGLTAIFSSSAFFFSAIHSLSPNQTADFGTPRNAFVKEKRFVLYFDTICVGLSLQWILDYENILNGIVAFDKGMKRHATNWAGITTGLDPNLLTCDILTTVGLNMHRRFFVAQSYD